MNVFNKIVKSDIYLMLLKTNWHCWKSWSVSLTNSICSFNICSWCFFLSWCSVIYSCFVRNIIFFELIDFRFFRDLFWLIDFTIFLFLIITKVFFLFFFNVERFIKFDNDDFNLIKSRVVDDQKKNHFYENIFVYDLNRKYWLKCWKFQ